MTRYLHIKNWKKFQHYKGRCPPWVKLHFEILTSADWVALADASKLVMVACMVVASRHEGRIPNDPEYIKRVAYLDSCDLAPLIACGFLSETLADDSERKQTLAPTPPETEEETDKKKKEAIGAKRVRTYSAEFDQKFWLPYPRTPVMSKAEAWSQWKKLAEEDRSKAISALPPFKAWLANQRDHPVVHACRFLSQRRFDGFDGAAAAPPQNEVARYLA